MVATAAIGVQYVQQGGEDRGGGEPVDDVRPPDSTLFTLRTLCVRKSSSQPVRLGSRLKRFSSFSVSRC